MALGAETKPMSWSKYAADSSAFKKINQSGEDEDSKAAEKATKKKGEKAKGADDEGAVKEAKPKKLSKVEELLAPHKDDPLFVEFMKTHAKGKGIWENDWDLEKKEKEKSNKSVDEDDVVEHQEEDDDEEQTPDETAEEPEVKLADTEISDADYMKSLQQKKADATKPTAKTTKKRPQETEKSDPSQLPDLLTIKIRNIPFKTKRQDVLNFFKPLKPFSVRLPTKVHGIVYVGFKLETDFKKAMLKDRSFWSECFHSPQV